MAMIFRQPGETGMKNLKAVRTACSLFGKNYLSSINSERKGKMKTLIKN